MEPAYIVIFFFAKYISAQSSGFGMASMPPTILTLQMIIDYAVEEKWNQVIFFDCIGDDGKWKEIKISWIAVTKCSLQIYNIFFT